MGVVAWQGVALWTETHWQLSRAAETRPGSSCLARLRQAAVVAESP